MSTPITTLYCLAGWWGGGPLLSFALEVCVCPYAHPSAPATPCMYLFLFAFSYHFA